MRSRSHGGLLTRAAALSTLVAALLAGPGTGFAFDAQSPASVNADARGLALKGYDPVAYFNPTAPGPVPGKDEFTAKVDAVVYRFASAANRDAFMANRAKYLPGYGGFCAMSVAEGRKLDADPTIWRLDEGRLYLYANADLRKKWADNVNGSLVLGDRNWARIRSKPPASL